MSPQELLTEITTGQHSGILAPLARDGKDGTVADLFNLVRAEVRIPVAASRASIKGVLITSGELLPILESTLPIARTAAYVLADQDFAEIDLNHATAVALLDGLVAAGLLAPGTVQALLARSTRAGSWAEEAFGPHVRVSYQDVAAAMGRG